LRNMANICTDRKRNFAAAHKDHIVYNKPKKKRDKLSKL